VWHGLQRQDWVDWVAVGGLHDKVLLIRGDAEDDDSTRLKVRSVFFVLHHVIQPLVLPQKDLAFWKNRFLHFSD
jgi:hypothetical protein